MSLVGEIFFFNEIFSADQKVALKDTNIYGNRREACFTTLNECLHELKYLINANDNETSEYQRRIYSHKSKMKFLFDNKLFLLDTEDVVVKEKTDELVNIINTIRKTEMKELVKKDLISPWSI